MMNKTLSFVTALALSGTLFAAPRVSRSSIDFRETPTAADIEKARTEYAGKNGNPDAVRVSLKSVDDASLAEVVKAFPGITQITIERSPALTSIAPLSSLRVKSVTLKGLEALKSLSPLAGCTAVTQLNLNKLTAVEDADFQFCKGMTALSELSVEAMPNTLKSFAGLEGCTGLLSLKVVRGAPAVDISAVKGLPELKRVEFRYVSGYDLTALAALPKLEELDLYGSRQIDLAPLAGCAKLEKINIYATKAVKDYGALAQIKSLEDVHTGLTDMHDLSWAPQLPKLEKLVLFAETFDSFEPLSRCAKLESLRLWNMRNTAVDVAQFAQGALTGSLEALYLDSSTIVNESAIANFKQLEKLNLSGVNEGKGKMRPLDLSFLASLSELKEFNAEGKNAHTSLSAVEKCTELKSLYIAFPGADLSVVAKLPGLKTVRIRQSERANLDKVLDGRKMTVYTVK